MQLVRNPATIAYLNEIGVIMNLNKLELAIFEAERFVERANSLKTVISETKAKRKDYCIVCEPKLQGNLHRSSMELTRVLAELRNSSSK